MMKRRRMQSDVLHLPEDIIRNILKRFPVKTLIRFQCVCKLWKNLIKNPSFIADHLQQQQFNHQNFSLLLESYFPWHSQLLLREFPKASLIDSLRRARIVGSCNGLLCVESDEYNEYPHSLSLWNPATTSVRLVPLTETDIFYYYNACVTGFGFSRIVDDYKIVRTWARLNRLIRKRVEVFSLSRGSWKELDTGNLLEGVQLFVETVTANGTIFWYGEKRRVEPRAKVIVSFDIAKEMFAVIPMPDLGHVSNKKLTVYDNKLAILCDIREDDDGTPDSFDLWVLNECTCPFGERWSWTKRSTRSPLSCKLKSRIVWRNEIVCQPIYGKGEENALYTMNLTTNEVKRFVISYESHIYDIHNFVESLVPVDSNSIEESGS